MHTTSRGSWRLVNLVTVGAVLCGGCADPRGDFVGTWKGPMKTIVRFPDGSSSTYPKGEVTVSISAPQRSDRVEFNGACAMTARVSGERTLSIDARACPGQRVSFSDSGRAVSCDLVETVSGGAGNLEASALTLSYFGESQLARCTDGASLVATYTTVATLTQQ